MNMLKVRTPKGRFLSVRVQQNPPKFGRKDSLVIKTAAAVKADLLSRGYTLMGSRQK